MAKKDKIHFQVTNKVDKQLYEAREIEIKHEVTSYMVESIARHIAENQEVETEQGRDSVSFKLELYIASPKQFWEAVHEQAEIKAEKWLRLSRSDQIAEGIARDYFKSKATELANDVG